MRFSVAESRLEDGIENRCVEPSSLAGRTLQSLVDEELGSVVPSGEYTYKEFVFILKKTSRVSPDVRTWDVGAEMVTASMLSDPSVETNTIELELTQDMANSRATSSYSEKTVTISRRKLKETSKRLTNTSIGSSRIRSYDIVNLLLPAEYHEPEVVFDVTSAPLSNDGSLSSSTVFIIVIVTVTAIAAVVIVTLIVRLLSSAKTTDCRAIGSDNWNKTKNVITCQHKDGDLLYFSTSATRHSFPPDVVRSIGDDVITSLTSSTSCIGEQKLRVYKWEDF